MKRILVGLVLLAVCASVGGVVAWAQVPSQDPLAARILDLRLAYENVVTQIVGVEAQLKDLNEQKLRLEGGILELERYQRELVPAIPIEDLFPGAEIEVVPAEEPAEE